MDFRSRRFVLVFFFCATLYLQTVAMHDCYQLFLSHAASLTSASNRLTDTAFSPGIGSGTLPSGWQVVSVPRTAIAANLNQAFDIQIGFFPAVSLCQILVVNNLT
jgi:hypothetical protein